MKLLLRITAVSVVLLLALAAAGLFTAIQGEPAVALGNELDPADIGRAVALARQNDPRHAQPGVVTSVALNERDLDLLLNHIAQRWLNAATQVEIGSGRATLRSSLHLPANPFGRWLNLQAQLKQTNGLPQLDGLQVGRLPLPVWLAESIGLRLLAQFGLADEWQLARDVIRHVGFAPQQLSLVYAWQGDSAGRVAAALLPEADQQRLRAYAARLVTLAAAAPADPSLARWLQALFELARQRSTAGGDAAAENRAAIVALTFYANGKSLGALLPTAPAWPQAQPVQLRLSGRDDFPLHLLISAALAVEGTGPLSKAIGVYKEVADSRGGSGFSFNDIAADRAGTRLGELALREPLRLQDALARSPRESDFMPEWTDLPEFMPEPEFKRRFGGVGAPRYLAMLAEIDRRVAALSALR